MSLVSNDFSFRTYAEAPILDQEHNAGGAAANSESRTVYYKSNNWQHFKPYFNNLRAVEVELKKTGSPTDTIRVKIKNADGTIDLASQDIDMADIPSGTNWFKIYFDETISLNPGDMYRITMYGFQSFNDSNKVAWLGNNNGTATYECAPVNCISGTQTSEYPDHDYRFRTYGYDKPIFADGFESGNLNKWDKFVGKNSLGSADYETEAVCKLCVVGAGALEDSKSLKVKFLNKKVHYVQDNSPTAEREYHARFKIKRGTTLKMNKLNKFKIMMGKKGAKTPFYLEIRRKNGAGYQIRAAAKKDGAGYATTAWTNLPKNATWVEVDWHSFPAGNTGYIKLYINNMLKVQELDIPNNTYTVESVRLGITAKIKIAHNITGSF
ncbi:MAG: hypothetical protein N2D54_00530, partial [Chloroflexota bacterium]